MQGLRTAHTPGNLVTGHEINPCNFAYTRQDMASLSSRPAIQSFLSELSFDKAGLYHKHILCEQNNQQSTMKSLCGKLAVSEPPGP
jgi:hypothetical protein